MTSRHRERPVTARMLVSPIAGIVAKIAERQGHPLVRIADVRAFLKAQGVDIDRATVDAALFLAERDYLIDLNVANAPHQLSPDLRAAAVRKPDGGLCPWATAR